MSLDTNLTYVVTELDTPHDCLKLQADFEEIEPAVLFRYWTEPDLLVQWWPKEAEVDAVRGGGYHLAWPNMEWHLRGTYSAVNQGQLLVFTWHWDHEPDRPTRVVTADFQPLEDRRGTCLYLTHGYYEEHAPKDAEERQGHLQGWQYFLGRLQHVVAEQQDNEERTDA